MKFPVVMRGRDEATDGNMAALEMNGIEHNVCNNCAGRTSDCGIETLRGLSAVVLIGCRPDQTFLWIHRWYKFDINLIVDSLFNF